MTQPMYDVKKHRIQILIPEEAYRKLEKKMQAERPTAKRLNLPSEIARIVEEEISRWGMRLTNEDQKIISERIGENYDRRIKQYQGRSGESAGDAGNKEDAGSDQHGNPDGGEG